MNKQNLSSPVPGRIVIAAYKTFIDKALPSSEDYMNVRRCGFNLAIDYPDLSDNEDEYHKVPFQMGYSIDEFYKRCNYRACDKTLDSIRRSGLKLLLHGWQLKETLDVVPGSQIELTPNGYTVAENKEMCRLFVERYKDRPEIAGWDICDEPSDAFISKGYLTTYNDLIKSVDQNGFSYINFMTTTLDPSNSQIGSSSNENLETSRQNIISIIKDNVKPDVWSYDFYPIVTYCEIDVAWKGFIKSLLLFKEYAENSGRPFWAYYDANSYISEGRRFPAATEAYLRYEAFFALAFGAQGIVCWSYSVYPNNGRESFPSSLIDENREKTPGWYAAQKVNREINRYNHVFFNCQVKDIRRSPKRNIKPGETTYLPIWDGPIGPLLNLESSIDNWGATVSHIENGSKKFLVVLNNSPIFTQTFNLYFSSSVRVIEVSPHDISDSVAVEVSSTDADGTTTNQIRLDRIVNPGGYLIFEWL